MNTEDTKDLYRRLTDIASQPVLSIPLSAMENYLLYFENQCAGSKKMTDAAKAFIPGGVQPFTNRSFVKPVKDFCVRIWFQVRGETLACASITIIW